MAIRHVRPVDADGLEAGAVIDSADARAAQLAKLRGIADVIRSDHGTSQDLVLVALRGAIVAGVLEPGTRLRQEELAEVFGTSRIPVREALRALQYEGLVTSEPNHTSTVSRIDPDDIDELFDLRILVEGHALRLGVPLLTPEDIAGLQALRDAIAALPLDDQPAAVDRFYLRLYAATGRPRLVELVGRLRRETSRVVRDHIPAQSSVPVAFWEAIRVGDADRAVGELTALYQRANQLVRRASREPEMRRRLTERAAR